MIEEKDRLVDLRIKSPNVRLRQISFAALMGEFFSFNNMYEEANATSELQMSLLSLIPAIQQGLIQVWIGEVDDEIQLFMLTELVSSPRGKFARVISLTCHCFEKFKPHFGYFEAWARANGAEKIEAFCSDRLLKVHEKRGFRKVANVIQKSLVEVH